MNRRTFLTGGGATLSVAIAGCTGSDTSDDQEDTEGGPETQYLDSSEAGASEGDESEGASGSDDSDPDREADGDTAADQDENQPIDPAESVLEVTDLNVTDVEADEEYVEFTNTADEPVDLAGAYVRDGEGGQVDNGYSPFRFRDKNVLQPGESIRLWSGNGMNSMYDVYWKYNATMWDDEGDTIIVVYDGERILEHSY